MSPSRVVLAGGSGFLGRAVAASLLAAGHEVFVLTRRSSPLDILGTPVFWDPAAPGDWSAALDGAAALVNLAGRSISCRHTPDNCREIVRSRVESVRALGTAIRGCRMPPRTWVQASATGIYGDSGDRICDESTPTGAGFLAETCQQWENAFHEQATPGVRRVVLRLGIVLGRNGGALPPLARLARWFLGGSAGSGRQYVSWLHLTDVRHVFLESIRREDLSGTYVAASPEPVTNAEFMRGLRGALHRPWSPPAPTLAVRLGAWAMGVDASLALTGQRCVPRRLLNAGFVFEQPEIRGALRDLMRPEG
jgi:uncharacterized protein (TIGR01777 family)